MTVYDFSSAQCSADKHSRWSKCTGEGEHMWTFTSFKRDLRRYITYKPSVDSTTHSGYPEGYLCNSILNASLFLLLHFPSLNTPLLSDRNDGRDMVAVFLIDPIVVTEELWAIGFWGKVSHYPQSLIYYTCVSFKRLSGPWGLLRQCTHYLQIFAFLVFHWMSTRPDPTVRFGITESQVELRPLVCQKKHFGKSTSTFSSV